MSGRPWLLAVGLVVALTSIGGSARADVVPPGGCASPNTAECSGKKAGDACTFANGNKGNCATLSCTTDAGQPLLQCVATGASPSGGCSATGGQTGGSAGLGAAMLLLLGLAVAARRQVRS